MTTREAWWADSAAARVLRSIRARQRRARRVAARRRFLRTSPSLSDAGGLLAESATRVTDDPIFVLAAGWRTGSTLLQRMIIEAGALVWGEPYAMAGPSQSLASMLGRALTTSTSPRLFVDTSTQHGEALWLRDEPNLYPPLEDFVDAQRAWFRRLFAEPASRLGFDRWGMRETRLDAENATYLRLLFPRGRIVFLYRNPYDAWASLRRTDWVVSTPDEVITTAAQFGRHWRHRVEGFLSSAGQLDAHLVSYESMCGDAATRAVLADYLGLRFKDEALDHHTWSSAGTMPRRDVAALAKAAAPTAAQLGYRGPTTLRGSAPGRAGC